MWWQLREEIGDVECCGFQDVEVQVAVADVAVPAHFEIRVCGGDDAIDLLREIRASAEMRTETSFLYGVYGADALRNAFAQLPQICALARRSG